MSAGLADNHRAMLEDESGISPEVVAARGYRTVTTKRDLEHLGFSPQQRRNPALLIPIFSPTGNITLYQSRPDTPRKGKKEKVIKYETCAGSKMSLDMHPSVKDKAGDPKTPLFVTEGVKKGDALTSRGLCAVALIGVWNWRGTNGLGGKTALPEWEDVALDNRRIYIVFDSDVMLKKEVHAALVRLKAFLEHRGANVALIYLPIGDGATKQGVDDYLAAGHNVNDLLALATSEVRGLEPEDSAERVGAYLISKGAICHERSNRDGATIVALCNFTARIIEERLRDDGLERTLTLVITGKLQSGVLLPTIEVSAAQFPGMNWAVPEWGSRAVVNAGQGAKDHLRAALQMLSGDVPRRVTFTHLGWREVDGQMVYLHAGGAIGSAGLITDIGLDLSNTLARYDLPEPPTGSELRRAVLASLKILSTAPESVTAPLLAAIYRAPLGSVDFGLHLVGTTGAGKSELAALTQQHYGLGLDARNLPGSWSSTANSLEELAFLIKDAPAVIDDFAPEGSSHDIARYHATAARLFRAQGNNSARGRMQGEGGLRGDRPPRGLIISTGEDTPRGHSIKARTLILELEPRALNWQKVTEAQREAASGSYAAAMSAYLQWIAADYTGRTTAFRAAHHQLRGDLQSGGHKRTVDAGAQLLATWDSFITFATDTGALSADEGAALWKRTSKGVLEALEPQAALQSQSDPVARFYELLNGALTSNRAHVADAKTGEYPGEGWGWEQYTHKDSFNEEKRHRAKSDRIGWLEGENLYLEPSATYRAVSLFARDQAESIPVTERTLWKRLEERGHLLSTEKPRLTIRKRGLSGAKDRTYVLHLASTPVETEPSEPSEPSAVRDSIPRPKIGLSSGSGFSSELSPVSLKATPEEVKDLHKRFSSGDFADRPELNHELGRLFGVSPAKPQQKARLRELAHELVRTETVGMKA